MSEKNPDSSESNIRKRVAMLIRRCGEDFQINKSKESLDAGKMLHQILNSLMRSKDLERWNLGTTIPKQILLAGNTIDLFHIPHSMLHLSHEH